MHPGVQLMAGLELHHDHVIARDAELRAQDVRSQVAIAGPGIRCDALEPFLVARFTPRADAMGEHRCDGHARIHAGRALIGTTHSDGVHRSRAALEIGEAFFPADVPSLQQLSPFAVFAVALARCLSLVLAVAVLPGMLLIATWLEASLGFSQGPALNCLILAVPTLLAYRQLERHLLPDWPS